jgi:hypothetical protein
MAKGKKSDKIQDLQDLLEKTVSGSAPKSGRKPLRSIMPDTDTASDMRLGEKFDKAVYDIIDNTLTKIGAVIKSKLGGKQEVSSRSGTTNKALSEQTQQRQELLKTKSGSTRKIKNAELKSEATPLTPLAVPSANLDGVAALSIKNVENLKVTAKNVTIEGFDGQSNSSMGGVLPIGNPLKGPNAAKVGGKVAGAVSKVVKGASILGAGVAGVSAYDESVQKGQSQGDATKTGVGAAAGTLGGAALGGMVGGRIAGGIAGAALGPVGVLVGSIIGGMLGEWVGKQLGDAAGSGDKGTADSASPMISGVGGLTFNQLTKEQKNALLQEQKNQEGFRPGTMAYRMNNPGNIIVDQKTGQPFAKQQQFGATRGDTASTGLTFAKFPDLKSGEAAQRDLWERKYGNMPLEKALETWARPGSPGYKAGIYRAIAESGPVPDAMPNVVPVTPTNATPKNKAKAINELFERQENLKDSKQQQPVVIMPPVTVQPQAANQNQQIMLPIAGVRPTENAYLQYVNRGSAFV